MSEYSYNLQETCKDNRLLAKPSNLIGHPECSFCEHIIQRVNEIFEQDDDACSDPMEYCLSHLLETIHTSLVKGLLNQ